MSPIKQKRHWLWVRSRRVRRRHLGRSYSSDSSFSPATSISSSWTFCPRSTKRTWSGRATWTRKWKTCATCYSTTFVSRSSSSGSIQGHSREKRHVIQWITIGSSVRATSSDLSLVEVSRSRSTYDRRFRSSLWCLISIATINRTTTVALCTIEEISSTRVSWGDTESQLL